MKLLDELAQRSNNQCELCGSSANLSAYTVSPKPDGYAENSAWLCQTCRDQLERKEPLDPQHWNILSEKMWAEVPAIQVLSWRILQRLKDESWAAELLEIFYLDDETQAWASAAGEQDAELSFHTDANGNRLQAGDTVVLTRSLDVKGSALHAKMGTVVRNIRLVEDNTEQIEGKIEGQLIVILTKYVRRQKS